MGLKEEEYTTIPDIETGMRIRITKKMAEAMKRAMVYFRPNFNKHKGKPIIFGTAGDPLTGGMELLYNEDKVPWKIQPFPYANMKRVETPFYQMTELNNKNNITMSTEAQCQHGDMSMGDIIASLEVLTSKAKHTWFVSEPPFTEITQYLETISALSKQALEQIKCPICNADSK